MYCYIPVTSVRLHRLESKSRYNKMVQELVITNNPTLICTLIPATCIHVCVGVNVNVERTLRLEKARSHFRLD